MAAEAIWKFDDGQRTWNEAMNLIKSLTLVLEEHGHQVEVTDPLVIDMDSRLSFRPLLASMEPVHQNGVKTVTTIEVTHPERIPLPIFEFQHAAGPDLEASIQEGFRQWYNGDFPALRDAVRVEAVECQEMSIASQPDQTSELRRITLGPVLHYRQDDLPDGEYADHCFCPCCLFTNSMDAFAPLLASGEFHALRLFALRDEQGNVDADCRVNGENHETGKQALIRYATSWAPAGMEFRKQYVVIQGSHPGSR